MRVHILTDQIGGGGYGGGRGGLSRGRLIEGCRYKVERCTVKSVNWLCRSTKLFAIIYLNLEIYYIVPGLEIYTRPLVFMSSLSVRTSENCYWLALSDE